MKPNIKLKALSILSLSLLLGLGAVSCGGDDGGSNSTSTVNPTTINVESVLLTTGQDFVKVTQTIALTTTISPSNATNKNVTYSVSNDCASVDTNGVVTGVKVGDVDVTVTTEDGNKTSTISLKVVENSPYSYLNITEYGDALKSTPYAIENISGQANYGLADGGVVGVKQNDIKELYSVKADSEYQASHLIDVESIDAVKASEYFTDVSEINDYYKVATAIKIAEGITDGNDIKIKFPNRTLEINGELSPNRFAFSSSSLKNVTFEGNGAIIKVITNDLNFKGYLNVSGSNNVLLHNITFRLAKPSSLTGTITDVNVDEKWIKLTVDGKHGALLEDAKRLGYPIRSWVEFDHNYKAPLEGGNFIVDGCTSYEVEGDASTGYTLKVNFASPISRSRNKTFVAVQFSQYDAYGMSFNNSENIYIENVTMNHAAGMAFTASEVTNMYVNRFNLMLEEGSDLLMTATADAMHFNSMHGDVKINNSLIEYSHDDGLNLKHNYWYKLTEAVGGSTKKMTVTRITSAITPPQVGDHIAVYDEDTFEGHNPKKGYYTITSVETTAAGYTFTVEERMSNAGEWGSCRVTFLSNTPKFEFTNNIIRNKRNRGILVQVPNALIANNTFQNVGHGSIQAASSMDIYNEATIPQAPTIINNKFINNCYIRPEPLYGDIAIFAIASNASVAPSGTINTAKINNNFIANNGNASISIRGVGESEISNNLFYEPSRIQPSGDTFNCIIHMYNCADIDLLNNYNHYTLNKNLSGLILQGKTAPDSINLDASNKNIEFQRNEEAGPDVDVTKATSTITIDGNIDEWTSAGATVIEIDGISDAEGNPRTADEVKANFAVNSLMITHDDQGIYLGFDIYDNEISCKTVDDFWLGDCVEIFMTSITNMPNADMQVYKDEGGVIQAAFAPTWEKNGFFTFSSVRTNKAYLDQQLQVKIVETGTGYVGEVLIPFTVAPEFKTTIDEGKPIAMAIVVADCQREGGLKRVQAANVPHFVEDYKTKSARMPQYYFK